MGALAFLLCLPAIVILEHIYWFYKELYELSLLWLASGRGGEGEFKKICFNTIQIKGYRLLEGYRGKPPVDINVLLKMVVTVSEIIATGLIKEIDLNPVSLYPEGAMVLDAKVLVNTA